MTVETGYLGKRELHGALARHSPYRISPRPCVVCREIFQSSCEIIGEVCHQCWLKGHRQANEA